jgi:N utilization substance protein B
MPHRKHIRRLAMQLLYQFDLRAETDRDAIAQLSDDSYDSAEIVDAAFDLAVKAWDGREKVDALVTELAPDWPTYRQPPVDRAILRLAYYEMISGHAPVKVAINEAVQLAKHYAAEQSPAFVNGVLDKIAKQLDAPPAEAAGESDEATKSPDEAWLNDAVAGESGEGSKV